MQDFTLEQLSLFIITIMGACGGLLVVIFKSKCSKISCCGATIERNTQAITTTTTEPTEPQALVIDP